MELKDFQKDYDEWNTQAIMFSGESDMKLDFGQYLIQKYYFKANDETNN